LYEKQEARLFRQISKLPFRVGDDKGSIWNEFGHDITGGGQGLQVADGYLTEWYEWVNHWPETEIANR
jgi:hypothetical protein